MNQGILVDTVPVRKGFAVDADFLVPDLNYIAGNADNPFDIVQFRILGKLEHDDVVGLGSGNGDERRAGERHLHPVDELADQDMVADLQGRQHGPGGYLEGLDDEGADDQGKDDSNADRLEVLAEDRFLRCKFFVCQNIP